MLSKIIDKAREIKYETFKKRCNIIDGAYNAIKDHKNYKNDFHYFKFKNKFLAIYFYTYSAIEHFYY